MTQKAQKQFGSNTKIMPKCTTKKSKNVRQRARTWLLTLNNPSSELLTQLTRGKVFEEFKIIKYLIQEETGESGTQHLQGAIQFADLLLYILAYYKTIGSSYVESKRAIIQNSEAFHIVQITRRYDRIERRYIIEEVGGKVYSLVSLLVQDNNQTKLGIKSTRTHAY